MATKKKKRKVVLLLAPISILASYNLFGQIFFSRFITRPSIEKIEYRNASVLDTSYDDCITTTNINITSSEKYETGIIITADEGNNNGAELNVKNNEDDNINVGTHQTDNLLCTREQIQKGYWKNIQREKAPYESKEKWESSCYQRGGFREGRLQQSPFNDWEWNIDEDNENCSLLQFDINRFCRLGINRTIAFLGDSLTWQQFQSLNFLIGATDEHRQQAQIKTHACSGNTTKLIWERDNSASANGLKRIIQRSDPDVILINRGAHFMENETLLSNQLNETLNRALIWQQDCDKRNRDCLLLWRTTAPGFPNCDQIPGPISISNRSIAENMIMDRSSYTEVQNAYHWGDFASQNVLVEDLIQYHIKVNQLRISFIDFYDMAILRPDHHINKKDCLHWCLPGPIDAANTVLLHELEVAALSKKNR
jgi:hypothetical protein